MQWCLQLRQSCITQLLWNGTSKFRIPYQNSASRKTLYNFFIKLEHFKKNNHLILPTLQKIMVLFIKNFGQKTPPYGFLPHVQLDQNVILDKLFRIWPFWLGLWLLFFTSFYLLKYRDSNNLGNNQVYALFKVLI